MKKKTVGEKIADLRRERKIQQDEFADIIGVSRQALSQWETGKQIPRADKIAEICEKFGVDGNYFYSEASASEIVVAETEKSDVAPMPEFSYTQNEKAAPMPEAKTETETLAIHGKDKPSLLWISKIYGVALAGVGVLLLLFLAIAVFIVAISPNVNETTVRVWAIDPLAAAIVLLILSCVAAAWVVICLIALIREGKRDEKK